MNVSEALVRRRAIKAFDPSVKMTEAEIRRLFELTLLSPSSFNLQHWRFVAVTDQAVKDKLTAAAWNQQQVSQAALVVVVCAWLHPESEAARYWRNAPQAVQDMLVPMIGQFYNGNDALCRDEAIRSASLASMSLMLAAQELGYDTCPMVGYDPAQVAEIIGLPKDHILVMMIPVGRKAKDAHPKPGQLGIDEVVVRDRFP